MKQRNLLVAIRGRFARVRNNALREARRRSRSKTPTSERGFCLRETRECYNVAMKWGSAAEAWAHTTLRGHGRPPRGAVVYWTGGSEGDGHVGIATGYGSSPLGDVYSTDIRRGGWFDKTPIEAIHAEWPNVVYAGWAKDINGVRVIE